MVFGCTSTSHLKKFEEGDIGKEISSDVAKKFEVKDSAEVGTVQNASGKGAEKKAKAKKLKLNKGSIVSENLPGANLPPVRHIDPMPFDVGEKLQYDIRYVGVTAGYFNTEILPHKFVNGRKVYQLRAKAKTVKLFELVYRVDDTIESFFDYDGLYSHRFTMDLDESKQTRKLIELYDYDKKQSFFWNRIDHAEKGLKEEKNVYDIMPWSQDPLSSLFFLRAAKLPTEPSQEFRFPIILDGKPWEGRIRYKGRETIYAGGKNREADAYHLENYHNGELKNRENTIWISADEHRYILRVEAKVKVGAFAVALDKIL